SALVTDACAQAGARTLVVAGAGVQARQQVVSVCAVRPIEEVRVWARRTERAAAFVEEVRGALGRHVRIAAYASLDEAARGADVIGTATAAKAPIARFGDLADHVHINCMGGHTTESRELPPELLRHCTLIVEDVPTAVAEAGPLHAGALSLADLVKRDMTELRDRRTVFGSTGHAFLDLVTTAHLLRALGVGETSL
nr:hypothetical protein [Polyangiaceae bacterium]